MQELLHIQSVKDKIQHTSMGIMKNFKLLDRAQRRPLPFYKYSRESTSTESLLSSLVECEVYVTVLRLLLRKCSAGTSEPFQIACAFVCNSVCGR